MNLGLPVASPDGTRVAVVESDTDAVAVVEAVTGRVELVSPLNCTESVGPFLPGEALKNCPLLASIRKRQG